MQSDKTIRQEQLALFEQELEKFKAFGNKEIPFEQALAIHLSHLLQDKGNGYVFSLIASMVSTYLMRKDYQLIPGQQLLKEFHKIALGAWTQSVKLSNKRIIELWKP